MLVRCVDATVFFMTKQRASGSRALDPRILVVQIVRAAMSAGEPETARKERIMGSKNAETAARIASAFNERDWDGVGAEIAEECLFSDPVQDHKGPEGFVEGYNKTWVAAFSDARMTDVQVNDAGATVIVEFVGTGTNDGPLGDLPPTGRQAAQYICEVYRFGPDGTITGGRSYYDRLGILAQLGHVER